MTDDLNKAALQAITNIVAADEDIPASVLAPRKDYAKWFAENPGMGKAAEIIGPKLGIGPIAAAQVMMFQRYWVS